MGQFINSKLTIRLCHGKQENGKQKDDQTDHDKYHPLLLQASINLLPALAIPLRMLPGLAMWFRSALEDRLAITNLWSKILLIMPK